MKYLILALIHFSLFLFHPTLSESQQNIVVLEINGAINPIVAEYVEEEIQQANLDGETMVIISMDTPGGLDTSMRQIIKAIQRSDIPIASFVNPSGSRAASAGTFITIASHIAAMAPGTNIGAAHPVNMLSPGDGKDEKEPSTMEEKVVNDASAYIRSLAQMRGRNAHWAEMSVRESYSISATEAKKLAVIDLIAANLEALILAVDGREIKFNERTLILKTAGKSMVVRPMNKRQQMLDLISDPNIAYILLMIGFVGLYFELSNPGLILPGVVGGISIILALYAMQALPINYAGLLLIVLGCILFIAEINVMSYGLLSVGGGISILLGSLMLIDSEDPAMQLSRLVIFPTVFFSVLVAVGGIYFAGKMKAQQPITGEEGMVGAEGVVKADLCPEGTVLVHGELWNAHCEDSLPSGTKVVVEKIDGLTVTVKPAEKE
ncbi:MAG: NfeD family protein [Nitrospinales bacterium]